MKQMVDVQMLETVVWEPVDTGWTTNERFILDNYLC